MAKVEPVEVELNVKATAELAEEIKKELDAAVKVSVDKAIAVLKKKRNKDGEAEE